MLTYLNIVFIICHDLGQFLGCYGVNGVRSRNIDAFADDSIKFVNSFCTAPQCSPSRSALFTGRFPHSNGVVGLTHGEFRNDLNPGEKHLAEILFLNGYETHLFGTFHEASSPERCGYKYVHAKLWDKGYDIATSFCDFVKQRKKSKNPFFAQIGFVEPHRPFSHDDTEVLSDNNLPEIPKYLPDIPEVREDLANMEASIVSVDKAFGRVINAIRSSEIANNTIIVFTSDHGIAFPHSKMTLYDSGIKVPLLIFIPGINKGMVYNEMISNVDVMPTLLDLLDIPIPSNLHGRSFKKLITADVYVPNECMFAEKTYHTYYDPMRAIRTNEWKLIVNFENAPYQETTVDYFNNAKCYVEVAKVRNVAYVFQYHPMFELYNLNDDVYEQHNLAENPECKDVRDGLIWKLRKWMEYTQDPLLNGPMSQEAYRYRMNIFKNI